MIKVTQFVALEVVGILANRYKWERTANKIEDMLDNRWQDLSIAERKWLNSRGNPFT